MKLLRKYILALAACIATAGTFVSAFGAGLTNDPFIRQNTARENFEPGGKFHLFGSRGVTADRTGNITLTPVYRERIGNVDTEYALIRGNIGYNVRFANHHHHEHAPFTNSSSRSAADSKGNIGINLTSYNLQWSATEIHPADAYDGEQGGGYPAPTGARDEYTYKIKGTAAAANINLNDHRSIWERAADRFAPAKNLPADIRNTWKAAASTQPGLNRAGNAAHAVNAVAAGIGQVASAGAALIGAVDAVQGLGALTAAAGLEAVRALPPAAQTEAIRGIAATGAAVGRADSAVRSWARDNPNTAEVAKAAANAATAGFGAAKGINHTLSNYEFGGIGGNAVTRSQMGSVGNFGKKETKAINSAALESAQQRADRLSAYDRTGKNFTRAGKEAVIELNKIRNQGIIKCSNCGIGTVPAKKSMSNITPPKNERQIDHIIPKSKGGQGSPINGQVLCRNCNRQKGNK